MKRQIYLPSAGVCPPTALYNENADVGDALVLSPILRDDAEVGDTLALQPILTDAVQIGDDLLMLYMDPAFEERDNVNDRCMLSVYSIRSNRSGTPDNDFVFDAYINQADAAANFGNVALRVKKPVLGAGERRAYIAIDLTKFSTDWLTRDVGGAALRFQFHGQSDNLVTNQVLGLSASRTAAKPFTESTVTWSAPPTIGTNVNLSTATVDIPPAPGITTGFGITAANLQPCIGQWLLISFFINDPLDTGVDTVVITSRDGGGSNVPIIQELQLQRGT